MSISKTGHLKRVVLPLSVFAMVSRMTTRGLAPAMMPNRTQRLVNDEDMPMGASRASSATYRVIVSVGIHRVTWLTRLVDTPTGWRGLVCVGSAACCRTTFVSTIADKLIVPPPITTPSPDLWHDSMRVRWAQRELRGRRTGGAGDASLTGATQRDQCGGDRTGAGWRSSIRRSGTDPQLDLHGTGGQRGPSLPALVSGARHWCLDRSLRGRLAARRRLRARVRSDRRLAAGTPGGAGQIGRSGRRGAPRDHQ